MAHTDKILVALKIAELRKMLRHANGLDKAWIRKAIRALSSQLRPPLKGRPLIDVLAEDE